MELKNNGGAVQLSSCNFIEDDEEDCEIAEEEQLVSNSRTSHLSSSRLTSSEIEKDLYPV